MQETQHKNNYSKKISIKIISQINNQNTQNTIFWVFKNFPRNQDFLSKKTLKKIDKSNQNRFQKTQIILTEKSSKPIDLQALIFQTQRKCLGFHNLIAKSTKG